MLRRLIHLLAFLSILAAITSPAQATTRVPLHNSAQETPPLEANIDPTIDPGQYPPSTPLIIVFNQAMDPASAQPALLTFPYIEGVEAWDKDNKTLTYQPNGGFPAGKEIQVFLNSDLHAANGDKFEDVQLWIIETQDAPQVVARQPQTYELSGSLPEISIEFDREMDMESLQSALQLEPEVSFELNWNGKKVVIKITQPLSPGQVIKLSLSTAARDKNGTALDRSYFWSYQAKPFEFDWVKCSKKRLEFLLSHAIAPEDIQSSITTDPPLQGQWQSTQGNRLYFLEPESELAWSRPYTLNLKEGLHDTSGQLMPSIHPESCAVQAPISISPEQSESVWETAENVKIIFDTPMDAETVEGAFHIQPEVPGKLTFEHLSKSKDRLNFVPDEAFSPGVYTVTLDKSALTSNGEPILVESYQWQFTVWSSYYDDKSATFTDYGPNLQVIDADAPRYLQLASRSDQKLYFDAYPVDLPTFVQLYKDYFGNNYAYYASGKPGIDTTNLDRLQDFALDAKNGINDLLLPSSLPIGLYVLEMRTDQGLLDQIFIVLSRNAISAKLSGTRLFTWMTNINGENVPEAEIRVYTQTGELMREGKTDEAGIFDTSRPTDSSPMLVAARDASGDVTITGLNSSWVSHSDDDYWFWPHYQRTDTRAPRLLAYIFTDRPIYRPGNEVQFKAILRNDNDMRYTLISKTEPVKVRLFDARNNLLDESEHYPNEFGTINGKFVLPPEGNLGDYHLEVEAIGDKIQQTFAVQEYHKPDYSVSIKPDKSEYIDGDTVELVIDARYYLGQPVVGAVVTLKFYNYWGRPTIIAGKTGPDGRYVYRGKRSIKELLPWYQYAVEYDWGNNQSSATQIVEATVSDGSNQPVSSTAAYQIFNTEETIRLETHGYFKTPGEPFTIDIEARTYDGKPVANRAVKVVVYELNERTWISKMATNVVTDESGNVAAEIMLEEPNDYKISIQTKDSRSSALFDSAWVTAYEVGQAWNFQTVGEFAIRAEEDAYQPYQRAKLFVRSSFSGPALLTFERGSVIHKQFVQLTAPYTEIETEIIPEYAPNVFVTINAWQEIPYTPFQPDPDYGWNYSSNRPNSSLRIASAELAVENIKKPLEITVTSEKTSFAPRELAEFTIQVNGASGPVQAELAIGLVDEAIYSLKNEPWKPIVEAFYAPRPHTVSSFDSMAIIRYLFYESARGGGGGDEANPNSPRSDFPDTAIWLPAVVTDTKGQAVVSLTLPDTLTRWRLTVRAVTRNTLVGETTYTIQTEQAISIRPAFPSIVTEGDQFELVAYVHNSSEEPQTLTAALSVPGLVVEDAGNQVITVQPGQSTPVRWQARAATVNIVQATVQVSTGHANGPATGDSIRIPITVQPRTTLIMDQSSGQFNGHLNVPVVLPPTALDSSTVQIELYRSLAGNALSGLEALIGYPYGCVEQTMSKALPNAAVGRALARLGLSNPELEKRLPGLIDMGVKKLYGMQHYDGGWGWWTDDNSDLYQTAWVVFGLALTQEAGYKVDPLAIQRGASYLRSQLGLPVEDNTLDISRRYSALNEKISPKLKAFVLYSLALTDEADEALALELYQEFSLLDHFSQAALALTLHRLGRSLEAEQIIAALETSAYRKDGIAYWPGSSDDGEYQQKTMASEIRTAAMALEAIQTIRPESEMTGEIVRYLMANKKFYGWGTTNETAFTLLALTGQLEAAQASTGPTSYRVLIDGVEISQSEWNADDLSSKVVLTNDVLGEGLKRIEIITDSETSIDYSMGTMYLRDAAATTPAGNMAISRAYFDATTQKPITSFEVGQLIEVRLEVSVGNRTNAFIMIEDHLPGGLEALNEALNTTSREYNNLALYYYRMYGDFDPEYNPFLWEQLGYNQKEIHDGKVTFFITSLSGGRAILTYHARALRAGTFTALPAEVSAMYDLTSWGRTGSTIIEIH